MQVDAVAPEGAPCGEEDVAQVAGELLEGAPAGGGDLLRIAGLELLVVGPGKKDVRPPVELAAAVREDRIRRDEVALEPHAQPGLLERLPNSADGEVLARLDAAARRPPHPLGEVRLPDQRQPLRRIEDEE